MSESETSSAVPHVNVDIHDTNLRNTFYAVLRVVKPRWNNAQDIVYEVLEKGVTAGVLNTMVKCYHSNEPDDDVIMIRIPHVGLNNILNRKSEVEGIKYFHSQFGSAPNVLATFNNGFCYQFIFGEILNYRRVTQEPLWRKVAEAIATIHSGTYEDETLNRETLGYLKILKKSLAIYPEKMIDDKINERFQAEMPNKAAMTAEVDAILEHVTKLESPIVLCHNDSRAENIIWNENEDSLHFVDWEAIAYNYQAMEIAGHFVRLSGLNPPDYSLIPGKSFQIEWLKVYLKKYYDLMGRNATDVTNADVERLYVQTSKFYLLTLLFSAVIGPAWEPFFTGIPEGQVDILGFTINSMQEYYAQKDRILALKY